MSSDNDTKGVRAVMIIEVIGKPPEHLTETLNKMIKTIDEEKGVSVQGKKIKEPILMKDQKDFYASHAEVEVEVEEIMYLAMLMFKYMPAHLDIIEPEIIALQNNSWTEILNELTRRLHGYDEVARIVQVEKVMLEKKLKEALEGRQKEVKQEANNQSVVEKTKESVEETKEKPEEDK